MTRWTRETRPSEISPDRVRNVRLQEIVGKTRSTSKVYDNGRIGVPVYALCGEDCIDCFSLEAGFKYGGVVCSRTFVKMFNVLLCVVGHLRARRWANAVSEVRRAMQHVGIAEGEGEYL